MKVFAVVAVLLASTMARADGDDDHACSRVRDRGMMDGPVVIGLEDADLGTARRTCLHNEISIYERLGAVYDLPGFYGDLRADTIVAGSRYLGHHVELFGTAEIVHYEFVQNATIKATALGFGQITVGLQGKVFENRRFAISVLGRVVLPTATADPLLQTVGAEAGVNALFRPRRDLEIHGQISGDFSAGLSAGPAAVRGGTTLTLGVQYTPARWLAFVVDAAVVLGHRAALDAFLPQLALRFRVWRGLNLELDAGAPVGGADRRLAIVALRVGYRF